MYLCSGIFNHMLPKITTKPVTPAEGVIDGTFQAWTPQEETGWMLILQTIQRERLVWEVL